MALLGVGNDGDVTLRRAKDQLDKANVLFATIEERSQAFARATYESARRVDEWATNIVEKDRALSSEFVTHVDELGESLAREREKEQMELRTVADNDKEVELADHEVAELESIVNELQISKDALPAKERRLKEDLKDVKTRHRGREEHVRELERRLVEAIAQVQGTINQYQDALGLKMEILDDGHIKFTFICIDPQNPQAKFEVEVKREGTDQLNAIACEPMLRRFSELKQTLSHDGFLVGFLRDIRREFRALVGA